MSADHHPNKPKQSRAGWLERPATVNIIVCGLCLICVALAIGDLYYEKHPHFTVEGWFGFYPLCGLVAVLFLTFAAKKLRTRLMRPEDYYDSNADGGEDHA